MKEKKLGSAPFSIPFLSYPVLGSRLLLLFLFCLWTLIFLFSTSLSYIRLENLISSLHVRVITCGFCLRLLKSYGVRVGAISGKYIEMSVNYLRYGGKC
jgi:hypothetical protein